MNNMKVITVEITSCDLSTVWYAGLIGEKFECYDYGSRDYVLKEDWDRGFESWWRHITKDNCKVVETVEQGTA